MGSQLGGGVTLDSWDKGYLVNQVKWMGAGVGLLQFFLLGCHGMHQLSNKGMADSKQLLAHLQTPECLLPFHSFLTPPVY